MKKEVILKGKGFILRPYRKGDEFSVLKNSRNRKYTLKEAKKWISDIIKTYKKEDIITFTIDVGGFSVGHISGNFDDRKPHIFGIWYYLGEKYHGKGIMSEAIKLYTKYLFKIFKKLQRIEAETHPGNVGSQSVLEKNGFKLEGVLRKHEYFHGKLTDKYLFSKLRNER
ncbi:MAG: GNAT family protein [Candidatus Paceibacterota bacterium]|jgi:RimJ/RimL family protein N-acetyltransferase